MGSIEYSVEYIRLHNLLSRCRNCRNYRKFSRTGVRKQVFAKNGKIIIREERQEKRCHASTTALTTQQMTSITTTR